MDKYNVTTTTLSLTLVEVSEQVGIPEHMLRELLEQGVLHEFDVNQLNQHIHFEATQLARLQTAARLQDDLGVNVPGAVLAMELIDEISALKQALEILKRHFEAQQI